MPDEPVFVDSIHGRVTARSKDGDWMITCLTNMNSFTLKLNTISALKKVTAWWINPVNGTRKKIGVYSTSGNHVFLPSKKFHKAKSANTILAIRKGSNIYCDNPAFLFMIL